MGPTSRGLRLRKGPGSRAAFLQYLYAAEERKVQGKIEFSAGAVVGRDERRP